MSSIGNSSFGVDPVTPDGLDDVFLKTFVPILFKKIRSKGKSEKPAGHDDEIAMATFRQRISMHQAAQGSHYQRAPGFDYVRWKQHGQHRMHQNPHEYVLTCQGLAPYINSVAQSSFEGLEERRWAGLTQAPPPLGLQPRSGTRTAFGSRDLPSR